MTYLDANVFIFAACDQGALGAAARRIIAEIQQGKQSAMTSVLTYDEVVWGVRKVLNVDEGYAAGELFLSLPHLFLAAAERQTAAEAQHLMRHHKLKPRDALHLATMQLHNEKVMVSEDPDFDVVAGIQRIPLLKFGPQPENGE